MGKRATLKLSCVDVDNSSPVYGARFFFLFFFPVRFFVTVLFFFSTRPQLSKLVTNFWPESLKITVHGLVPVEDGVTSEGDISTKVSG